VFFDLHFFNLVSLINEAVPPWLVQSAGSFHLLDGERMFFGRVDEINNPSVAPLL
jgi:hypothetical protein